ncbi:glycosyltransferase family 39 protein [Candidatus Gottesmanbacteria bacterium]|nr:glycosyltransferase family 39 protein [Candidatus Gottesmanbacteria bacterium]
MINFLLIHTPLLYFTQSLWRDEAYSILLAQRPISFFFGKLTFEPPLYYILLHVWMKLFGTTEIAARSLSLFAFAAATIVVIVWAEKLFKHHWLSWFLPLTFFANPQLAYYAFEVRTYGWYVFFAILAMYGYLEKKWRLFVAASVLGFYTHAFFVFLPATSLLHYLIIHHRSIGIRRSLIANPMVQSLVAIGLLITPWLLIILRASSKLNSSWYYPVNFNLVQSVLGNMFFGYEGTPGFLWPVTAGVSFILALLFLWALKSREKRSRNLFFFLIVLIPLATVIGVSFVKPIFVNRYLIFVTIAEVFLIAFAIETIKSRTLKRAVGFFIVAMLTSANLWFPQFHKKVDMRRTFAQINTLASEGDVVYAKTPLILFESMYYSKHPNRVFLYNPHESPFPWYVGDALPIHMATTLPSYPARAFLVNEDGSFMVLFQTDVINAYQKSRR